MKRISNVLNCNSFILVFYFDCNGWFVNLLLVPLNHRSNHWVLNLKSLLNLQCTILSFLINQCTVHSNHHHRFWILIWIKQLICKLGICAKKKSWLLFTNTCFLDTEKAKCGLACEIKFFGIYNSVGSGFLGEIF